jgi:hypothetical protein
MQVKIAESSCAVAFVSWLLPLLARTCDEVGTLAPFTLVTFVGDVVSRSPPVVATDVFT